jgi:hypothetical protein
MIVQRKTPKLKAFKWSTNDPVFGAKIYPLYFRENRILFKKDDPRYSKQHHYQCGCCGQLLSLHAFYKDDNRTQLLCPTDMILINSDSRIEIISQKMFEKEFEILD